MPRTLLSATLLLVALVGCQRVEGRYRRVQVSVSDRVTVRISPSRAQPDDRHPCPPWLSGSARINGIAMEQVDRSEMEPSTDSADDEWCLGLAYELDVAQLPAATEELDITFDPLLLDSGEEYVAARAWRVATNWRAERLWTEDDLAARMRANDEFELRWEPPDEQVPVLSLGAFILGSWTFDVELRATLVSSEPGRARFRFAGPEPSALWSLRAFRERNLEVTVCGGFEGCVASAHSSASLQPGGISPAARDGVAPPRACIVAPGASHSDYKAPHWDSFPDLSQLQVVRDMSCDGADLYFVVLGACGVCGGGKSTYVVGNRGTRAVSFSVRSNLETVAGTLLEPQQLSAPFEISFQGALSQIEILSDADCDAASNAAWVASVMCASCQQRGMGGQRHVRICRPQLGSAPRRLQQRVRW